mmetsp:Transcript_4093/g.7744  ORF Transcript_4093/g.7744 Transcript_4093/m.7744 type:complete len:322 (+) Transcript_4093:38-1003(+)
MAMAATVSHSRHKTLCRATFAVLAAAGTARLHRDSLERRQAWLEFRPKSKYYSFDLGHRLRTSRPTGCWRAAGVRSAKEYRGLHVGVNALTQDAVAVAGVAALGAAAVATVVLATSSASDEQKPREDAAKVEGESRSDAEAAVDDMSPNPTLPAELEEALQEFDGDFRGPWVALGLDPDVAAEVPPEEIKAAYRQAVRVEHPDRSELPDAEARFNRVRKAYALLLDEGSRALLLEALSKEAQSFQELEEGPASGPLMLPRVPAIGLAALVGLGLSSWIRIGATGGPVRRVSTSQTSRSGSMSKTSAKDSVVAGVVSEKLID